MKNNYLYINGLIVEEKDIFHDFRKGDILEKEFFVGNRFVVLENKKRVLTIKPLEGTEHLICKKSYLITDEVYERMRNGTTIIFNIDLPDNEIKNKEITVHKVIEEDGKFFRKEN